MLRTGEKQTKFCCNQLLLLLDSQRLPLLAPSPDTRVLRTLLPGPISPLVPHLSTLPP